MKPRSATAVGRFGAPIFAAALVFFSISEARAQGIVAQATGGTGAASATQAFPLNLTTTLSSSVGSGTLAPGYTRQPNFSQTLTMLPTLKLPTVDWLPSAVLAGRMNLSVQWLSNFQGTFGASSADRLLRISDFTLVLNVPKLFQESFTGIRVGTNLQARAPLSLGSRLWNVLTTVGVNFPINWNTGKLNLPVGLFFLSYVPSVTYTQHMTANPTVPCSGSALDTGVATVGNPAHTLESIPLVITRPGEIAANGECIQQGRRVIGTMAHSATAGWASGSHTIIVSTAYFNQIFAPLNDTPDLSSAFASSQFFNEWTSGTVAYAYQIPSSWVGLPDSSSLNVTTGITSFQPFWDAKGQNMRLPYWDFVTPANNFSSFFFDLNLSI